MEEQITDKINELTTKIKQDIAFKEDLKKQIKLIDLRITQQVGGIEALKGLLSKDEKSE